MCIRWKPRGLGTTGIGCRHEAVLAQRFNIFFGLANENDGGFQNLPESVKDLAWGSPVDPAPAPIRTPLKEPFGVGPNHLVKQKATFVGVVVFRNDPASLVQPLFGPEAASDEPPLPLLPPPLPPPPLRSPEMPPLMPPSR